MIRIVDAPEGFTITNAVMWLEPVHRAEDLPDSFDLDCVALDLAEDAQIDAPWFYVGLGDGKACHVRKLPYVAPPKPVCPHCGYHL